MSEKEITKYISDGSRRLHEEHDNKKETVVTSAIQEYNVEHNTCQEKTCSDRGIARYREYSFPIWKGFPRLTEHDIETVVKFFKGSDDKETVNNLTKALVESWSKEDYYRDILLFIQAKLDKHISEGCNLGLCLDSSKETFGIMMVPCYEEEKETQVNCASVSRI